MLEIVFNSIKIKTVEENINLIMWCFTSKFKSPPEAEYKTAQPVKKNTNKIKITSQFIILHFSNKLLLLDNLNCNKFILI